MSIIGKAVNLRAQGFRENRDVMLCLVEELRDQVSEISLGGGERARKRHLDRGKQPVLY